MFRARYSRAVVVALASVAAVGVAAGSASAATSAVNAKPVTRLAGGTRIGTAIAISHQEFATDHTARNVVLTAAYTFADAMSAGPLGKTLSAPVLLTTPGLLDPSTLTEIQRVMPATTTTNPGTTTTGCASTPPPNAVYVVGGYAAIAQEIDTQLNQAGFDVVRVAGADRFATSVAVAQCEGSPSTVFLATGRIFADALAAGPAAASKAGTVLLTDGPTMPASVSAYLQGLSSPTVYAVGQAAHLADPAAQPIIGGDRFATAALVASEFFTNPTTFGIATGWNFPDALAGGAFMAMTGGPMLLTSPAALQSADGLYIAQNHTTLVQGFLFGGTASLSPLVAAQASAALNQS